MGVAFLPGSPKTAQAQRVLVTGSITDVISGEYLRGATVQVEGAFIGTITNDAGEFSLRVASFPVTLVVRHIGYESEVRTLESYPPTPLQFELVRAVIEMQGVTVTGENPAINIMRRVIEEKRRWRELFDTYQVNAYNRFRIENDTGIVSIWESSTLAFWDKERGVREISLDQKQTANTDIDDLLPAALFMNNLYDDDVEVAGHTLMGVTNEKALDYYKFEMAGTRAIDDQLVYDITVEPKSRFGSGFRGSVAVLDSVYALLEVELEPGAAFLFPPPITSLTVRYRQQFSQFGSDVWLPVDLRSTIALDIEFGVLLAFPTFHLQQFTRLSDFELNVPVPDSLYEGWDVVAADSTLLSTMDLAELEDIAIPLTAEEELAYESIDSTMTLEQSFKPQGLLARFVDMDDDSSGSSGGSSASGRSRSVLRGAVDLEINPHLWFNQVEGWHLGGQLSAELRDRFRISGRGGYETARKEWNFGGAVRFGKKTWVEAGFMDQVSPRYVSAVQGRFLNTLSVLVSQPDYYDYLHEQSKYVAVGSRVPGLADARLRVRYVDSEHTSVSRNISKGLFGSFEDVFENKAIDEGTLRSLQVGLRYAGDSIPFGIGGQYTLAIDIERSLSGSIVEDEGFTRYHGSLVWRIPTFYTRRLLPNTLDFKIMAGTYSGRLPRQRFGIVDGTGLITLFGGLKTRTDRPYEGEQYVAFIGEHSFRSLFFEGLGLYGMARKGWNVILTGGVAKTWGSEILDRQTVPVHVSYDQLHTEMGVSLSGLFSFLRVDYSARLDAPGYRIGVSAARLF